MPGHYSIDILTVKAAKAGDKRALAALYHAYSKPMFGICLRMAGNNQDAEDVLQEAFVSAFNNIAALKNEALFGSWLRRIVINECIRFSREKRYWENVEEIDQHEEEDDVMESCMSNVTPERIQLAIQALPDGYRQVFTLFAIEDFSHSEIAGKLQISVSTSKSQYYKARKMLRELLSKSIQHGQI